MEIQTAKQRKTTPDCVPEEVKEGGTAINLGARDLPENGSLVRLRMYRWEGPYLDDQREGRRTSIAKYTEHALPGIGRGLGGKSTHRKRVAHSRVILRRKKGGATNERNQTPHTKPSN